MGEAVAAIREAAAKDTHRVVAELLAREPECRRILDVPCGAGAFLQRLAGRGYDVQGADVQNLLEFPGAAFVRADMNTRLPFESAAFDAIVSIDGIEHIERPFDFVRECHRVLRRGGVFLFSTPNISALRSRWRWLLTGFHHGGKTPLDETTPNPWHHIGLKSFSEFRYLLHSNGFLISAVTTNRVKTVSWLYLPVWPLAWLATTLVFRRWERDVAQRRRNREIRGQLLSLAVAFGEVLIVKAVRL
jgi:SAM-dependent methyltransferase